MTKTTRILILLTVVSFFFQYTGARTLRPIEATRSEIVTAIHQDADGFIWFGGSNGLSRYDGYNEVCFHDDHTEDKVGYINKVYGMPDKKAFLLATNEGLYRYDPLTGESFIVDEKLRGVNVKSCASLDGPRKYLATDRGVVVMDSRFKVSGIVNNRTGLSHNHVNVVVADKEGNILVGHRGGIDILSPTTDGKTSVRRHQSTAGGVGLMLIDANDNLWYNVSGKIYWARRTEWLASPEKSSTKISDNLECVTALDRKDEIWIGTRGDGVLRYSISPGRNPQQIFSLLPNMAEKNEINNSVVSLFLDRNKEVWVGTMNGVYLYSESDNSFNVLRHDDNNENTPSHDIISSIYADDESNEVWLGTSYGINRLRWDADMSGHTITRYVDHSTSYDFVGNNRILMMAPCGDGRFLISTKLALKIFDPATGTFSETENLTDAYRRHGMRYARSWACDKSGRIYIAFNQGGIGVWNPPHGVVPLKWPGHEQAQFRAIEVDSEGAIWAAADGKGLSRLTLSADGMEVVDTRNFDRSLFGNQHITALHIDSNRRIWAGTFSGLYVMRDNDTFREFDSFGTRFYVSSITEDKSRNLWISSTKGIYHIVSQEATHYYEIDSSGDIGKLWYIIGHDIADDGTIYLGGISGLIYFNPGSIKSRNVRTHTRLSAVKVDNAPVLAASQSLNHGQAVRLPAGLKTVAFEFTALNYLEPYTVRYAYKLEGRDEDYSYVDSYHRKVVFAGLSPGDYVLKVKSSTPSGEWSADESVYPFTIERSAATSWWAVALYVLSSLGIGWVVWQNVMARIRHNRETRLYKLKLLNFISINNKLRVPLTTLQAPVDRLMALSAEYADEEALGMLEMMQKNIKRMSDQIDDFIGFNASNAADSRLHISHVGIRSLLAMPFMTLSERAGMRGITLNMDLTDDEVKLFVDPQKIEMAISNLMTTSVNLSPEGSEIKVEGHIDKRHNAYVVTIADAGVIQFAGERKHRWWKQAKESPDEEMKRELFLMIVARDFIEMHKGRLRVKSSPGGTTYEIRLLLGLSHYSEEQLSSLNTSGAQVAAADPSKAGSYGDGEGGTTPDMSLPVIAAVGMDRDLIHMLSVEFAGEYRLRSFTFNKDLIPGLKDVKPACIIVEADETDIIEQLVGLLHRMPSLQGIPVIVTSTSPDEEFERFCYGIGIDLWMRQPLDLKYLHTRVNNLRQTHNKIIEAVTQRLIVNPREVNVLSSNDVFLANVMKIIEANISDEKFSVDRLASELNISNSVLYRRLKQLTDLSPIHFIRSVRLKRAAQLLRTGNYLVSEVCQMVGFADQRYFSSCFKAQYGVTPKAYSLQSDK